MIFYCFVCRYKFRVAYTGDLVHESTEAIVNPANIHLKHSSGAARAIADAAGTELEAACSDYIARHGPLSVAQPIHTTAGSLPSPISSVIHVAGPDSSQFQDLEECHRLLRTAFRNCLDYADRVLSARSLSAPAISSGKQSIHHRHHHRQARNYIGTRGRGTCPPDGCFDPPSPKRPT